MLINKPEPLKKKTRTSNCFSYFHFDFSEKQREVSRKREAGRQRESPKKPRQQSNNSSALIDQQPKRSALISIDRLAVPWKTTALDRQPSEQPLVSIDSERYENVLRNFQKTLENF